MSLDETSPIMNGEDRRQRVNQEEYRKSLTTCLKVSFMVFYAFLVPLHLFSLGVTTMFDVVCLIKEQQSMINCSQKVIITKPQPFVILFCLTNIINTIVVLTTLRYQPPGIKFAGFRNSFKTLAKKGSFWSLNLTFICVIVEYIIASCKCGGAMYLVIIITYILFITSRLTVAYFINYLEPVEYENTTWDRIYTCVFYWITLVLFFLDTCHAALAVTLDAAEKVTLLGNVKTGSRDITVVVHLIFLGIKATFEARLFMFYWNKLFHGNKDLFSSFAVLQAIQVNFNPTVQNRDF